jgi:uracil-DNA glycosylase
MRGQWIVRADGVPVLITLHPSALLRLREQSERVAGFQGLVEDLRAARKGPRIRL